MYAHITVNPKLAVVYHAAVEILTNHVSKQPRSCALHQVLTLVPSPYPFGNIAHSHFGILNFSSLQFIRVGVHKRQTYIRVGHLHRCTEGEMHAPGFQFIAKYIKRHAGVVATRAYGKHISVGKDGVGKRAHKLAHYARRLPTVDREGETDGFVCCQ